MLTDTTLKSLKAKDKAYKKTDRDGMYVTVSPAGTISFRYDYRLNGRRETLTIGRYEAGRESRGRKSSPKLITAQSYRFRTQGHCSTALGGLWSRVSHLLAPR